MLARLVLAFWVLGTGTFFSKKTAFLLLPCSRATVCTVVAKECFVPTATPSAPIDLLDTNFYVCDPVGDIMPEDTLVLLKPGFPYTVVFNPVDRTALKPYNDARLVENKFHYFARCKFQQQASQAFLFGQGLAGFSCGIFDLSDVNDQPYFNIFVNNSGSEPQELHVPITNGSLSIPNGEFPVLIDLELADGLFRFSTRSSGFSFGNIDLAGDFEIFPVDFNFAETVNITVASLTSSTNTSRLTLLPENQVRLLFGECSLNY